MVNTNPYSFTVENTSKIIRNRIIVSQTVKDIGSFQVNLRDCETFNGFEDIVIKRDRVEVFDGRILNAVLKYGLDGSYMDVSGFDYTFMLMNYPTTAQTITESSLTTTLEAILSETPIVLNPLGEAFNRLNAVETFDTFFDFKSFVFSDTTLEYDIDELDEEEREVDVGTDHLPSTGLKGCFRYDGATPRLYAFWRRDAGSIQHKRLTTTTWASAVDTGYNSDETFWSVAWDGTNVWLLCYDGTNMDAYIGTITDLSGDIAWATHANVVTSSRIRFGVVFDDSGHAWMLTNLNDGAGYECTDGGATWTKMFQASTECGANHEIHAILPTGSDGDMHVIVYDETNQDVELWLWDRSAGTLAFVEKVADQSDVDDLDACQDAEYKIHVIIQNSNDTFYYTNLSGSWVEADSEAGSIANYSMYCDGAENAYAVFVGAFGMSIWKWSNGVLVGNYEWGTRGTPSYCTCPRGYLQDGNVGFFATWVDDDGDLQMDALSVKGIRLINGVTTGSFTSTQVDASVNINEWGVVTADGLVMDEALWDTLKASDDSVLLSNDKTDYDLQAEGLSSTETSIKIKGKIKEIVGTTYISKITVSDRIDELNTTTNYENVYTAIKTIADVLNAEFYVTFDGTTYTLHFVKERGSDKSDQIILKTATSNLYPEITPNIKVLDINFDWTSYANCVLGIGGMSGNDRLTSETKDSEQIGVVGYEVWHIQRDYDIETQGELDTIIYEQLLMRNSALIRINAEFVDKNITGSIQIGDYVRLVARYHNLSINQPYRIVSLNREYTTSGEMVTAELSQRVKYFDFMVYNLKPTNNERWIISE